MKNEFQDVKVNDIFSETQYYKVIDKSEKSIQVINQIGESITLGKSYVGNLLCSADQYKKTVNIGLEDKLWTEKQIEAAVRKGEIKKEEVKVGDLRVPGLKTVWDSIGSSVFAVKFIKKSKKKTKKVYNEQVENAMRKASEDLLNGVELKQILLGFIKDPISLEEPGEERLLRGRKLEHSSSDGKYRCLDMDLDISTDHSKGIRQVTLSSITEILYDGVRYVKK